MRTNALPPGSRALSLISFVLIVAALSLARDFFIPLALAVLFSFLLAPVVRRFQKWKISRIPAVILTAVLAMCAVVAIGWIMAGQVVDLAQQLPQYKSNISRKLDWIRQPGSGPFTNAAETIHELQKEMNEPVKPTGSRSSEQPASAPTVPVQVVDAPSNAFEFVKTLLTQVISTLGTGAVVIVCVIFFLVEGEDIRDRLIHLTGKTQLHTTTQALNDAAGRVSKYLLMQLVVNVTYAIPITAGLYFIGVPNAALWGSLCILLRFIPYLGPLCAAVFPIAISLAVFDNWTQPALTIGLFITAELISNNFMEPWLYGSSTGLSATAIIVAAVFWTWLWGSVGLLLSTPLTVCIAVLGRYIPHLGFFEILLSDKPAMPPSDRFYQRLLATRDDDAADVAQEYLKTHTLVELYDDVIIPALALAEHDAQRGSLEEKQETFVYQVVRELIEELGNNTPLVTANPGETLAVLDKDTSPPVAPIRRCERTIICVPSTDLADELVALIISQLLTREGYPAEALSPRALASEAIESIAAQDPALVCISTMPPVGVMQARYLSKRLAAQLPNLKVVTGIWGASEARRRRLKASIGGTVVATAREALDQIRPMADCAPPEKVAAA